MAAWQKIVWNLKTFCIVALAVEWTGFGSCHFVRLTDTIKEIPYYIPAKLVVAIITGIIEVTIGILIFHPKTRRFAALSSLVLLLLYVPAVYNILVNDKAFPDNWSKLERDFVRFILIPNNVFLGFCSSYILKKRPNYKMSDLIGKSFQGLTALTSKATGLTAVFTVAVIMLLANIAGFSTIFFAPHDWHHTTASLWGMMCLAIGALIGFLFGIPKVNSAQTGSAFYRPNTNIEDVSDWLTKIIVGVGLVEFTKIGAFVNSLSAGLGKALTTDQTGQANAKAFALALIIYFFVAGILQGYLLTLLYLSPKIAASNITAPTNSS